jgi:vancomycin resistance protein VanJ
MNMLDQETLPVLVLCDCNTTPRTQQYAQMDQRLDDAFKVQGWGLGLTHGGNYRLHSVAIIRIDYLWYREPLLPVRVEVGRERGSSDHLPVWGDFVLQR